MLYSLGRYLRDAGFLCELVLLNGESAHFLPDNDSFRPDRLALSVRSVRWGLPTDFSATSAAEIRADLATYDFLIGCGTAPAFVAKAGRLLDVFVPLGDDIYKLPFPGLVYLIHLARRGHTPAIITAQRKAIEACPHIFMNATNPAFEAVIGNLQLRGKRHYYTPPMLYYKEYEPGILAAHMPFHSHAALLSDLRSRYELLIFQHGRQYWRSQRWPIDRWALKGNDMLIEGYSRFLKAASGRSAHLILFEYGADVPATKALIRSLRLEQHVTWLPLMPRKWIMAALTLADVVVGEMHRSWLTYGVACEALCAGKPLLHKRADEFYAQWYDALYPMVHAGDAADVAMGLQWVADNPLDAARTGDAGRAWLLEYGVRRPVQLFRDFINAAQVTP